MVFRPLMLAALLAPVLFSAPAQAACENITNAFAYNECLAKQGPQRYRSQPDKFSEITASNALMCESSSFRQGM